VCFAVFLCAMSKMSPLALWACWLWLWGQVMASCTDLAIEGAKTKSCSWYEAEGYIGAATLNCVRMEAFKSACCVCGGGTNVAPSPAPTLSPASCRDDALTGNWASNSCSNLEAGGMRAWSQVCGQQIEIHTACCVCGGGTNGVPSPAPTLSPTLSPTLVTFNSRSASTTTSVGHVSPFVVQTSIIMICTEVSKAEICRENNLATGGATHQSFVLAVGFGRGMPTTGIAFALSCSSRRLGSKHTIFLVESTATVADADVDSFAESVRNSSSDIAQEFESQLATTLGVEASATMSNVEVVGVAALDDDSTSGRQPEKISILVAALTLFPGIVGGHSGLWR